MPSFGVPYSFPTLEFPEGKPVLRHKCPECGEIILEPIGNDNKPIDFEYATHWQEKHEKEA